MKTIYQYMDKNENLHDCLEEYKTCWKQDIGVIDCIPTDEQKHIAAMKARKNQRISDLEKALSAIRQAPDDEKIYAAHICKCFLNY
jgi:hypothetical protein